MAPSDDPTDPKVIHWRLQHLEAQMKTVVENLETTTQLLRDQQAMTNAERALRAEERKDDQASRAESAMSLQKWGVILTVATIAFTLAGGVVAPFLQKMILGG